jgi:hypothetical protein
MSQKMNLIGNKVEYQIIGSGRSSFYTRHRTAGNTQKEKDVIKANKQ